MFEGIPEEEDKEDGIRWYDILGFRLRSSKTRVCAFPFAIFYSAPGLLFSEIYQSRYGGRQILNRRVVSSNNTVL